MKFSRRGLGVALCLVLALAISPAAARHKPRHVTSGWDGAWSGAWGGRDATSITISGGRVVSYQYGGQTTPVHSSHVTAKTVRYGDKDAQVVMTRTGAATAHATLHSSQGDGTAELTRQ